MGCPHVRNLNRRKRATVRFRKAGLGAVLIFTTVCVVACGRGSSGTGATSATKPVRPAAWHLDEETGALTTPFIAYMPSEAEERVVEYANQLATRKCMRDEGFEYAVFDDRGLPPDPVANNSRIFGVASVSVATKFGYFAPPNALDGQEKARAATQAKVHKSGYDGALAKCSSAPGQIIPPDLPDGLGRFAGYEEVADDDRVREATSEWRKCLVALGFAASDANPTNGVGTWTRNDLSGVTEEEIRTAVADVKCKQESGLLDAEATALAAAEQSLVDENGPELLGFRQGWDRSLKAADKQIAKLGGT